MAFLFQRCFTKHRLILAIGVLSSAVCLGWIAARTSPYYLPPSVSHNGLTREELQSVKAAVSAEDSNVFSALPLGSTRNLISALQHTRATTNKVQIYGGPTRTRYTIVVIKEGGWGTERAWLDGLPGRGAPRWKMGSLAGIDVRRIAVTDRLPAHHVFAPDQSNQLFPGADSLRVKSS